MTTKKFFNWALTFNVITSLLSVLFSFILFEASGVLASDDGLLNLIYYIKRFFDLLAVFTGYGTIMYAFSRYGFDTGVKATGIFSISVAISFVWQVVGSYFGFGTEFISNYFEGEASLDFFLLTVFYACGYCIITQFLPGLIIAVFTHYLTKKSTDKKTLFKLRATATLTILAINLLIITFFSALPFAEIYDYSNLPADSYWQIVLEYVEAVVIYGPIQFGMYYLTHYLYNKYTDKTQEITTNSKIKRKKMNNATDKKDEDSKSDKNDDAENVASEKTNEVSNTGKNNPSKGSKNNKRKSKAK